jgi:hypothetical protein
MVIERPATTPARVRNRAAERVRAAKALALGAVLGALMAAVSSRRGRGATS